MPKFLPKSEVEQLRKQLSTQDLSQYTEYLETLRPGEWGAVSLEKGESQRAVKRRLTTASKQKGMNIRYRKGREGTIIFEVR